MHAPKTPRPNKSISQVQYAATAAIAAAANTTATATAAAAITTTHHHHHHHHDHHHGANSDKRRPETVEVAMASIELALLLSAYGVWEFEWIFVSSV